MKGTLFVSRLEGKQTHAGGRDETSFVHPGYVSDFQLPSKLYKRAISLPYILAKGNCIALENPDMQLFTGLSAIESDSPAASLFK